MKSVYNLFPLINMVEFEKLQVMEFRFLLVLHKQNFMEFIFIKDEPPKISHKFKIFHQINDLLPQSLVINFDHFT